MATKGRAKAICHEASVQALLVLKMDVSPDVWQVASDWQSNLSKFRGNMHMDWQAYSEVVALRTPADQTWGQMQGDSTCSLWAIVYDRIW